jgi:LacI family transcriptional regulator
VINPSRIVLRQSTERHNIRDQYILRVVKYIDHHYHEDLTIDTLLADIPLSRRNFEVKFKAEMQTTIYQYILNCRCDRMAELVQTSDLSLKVIVSIVGFKDYNNVSRIFKKYKGCSPMEFRKQHLTGR